MPSKDPEVWKRWRSQNKERLDLISRRYRENNGEVLKIRSKARRDRLKAETGYTCDEKYQKEYRESNRDDLAARQREYYKKRKEVDPDYNHRTNLEFRLRHPKRYIFQNAKARAKASNFEFSITEDDFEIPEVCPALGIPVFVQAGKGKSPNSPSLDRIDSKLGYVKDNVQVLSWRANNLKSDGTPDEFKKLSEFLNG